MNDNEYGPALLVGAYEVLAVGGAYGIKSKHFYALISKSFTLFK